MCKAYYVDALDVIYNFRDNPAETISKYYSGKGKIKFDLIKSREEIEIIKSKVSDLEIRHLTNLMNRLDLINQNFAKNITLQVESSDDTTLILHPIEKVGLYIPKQLPSSAYTYLSAIKSAGVNDIIVYLAQDEDGNLDPLSVYVADLYGAKILGGPARFAFPTLAFGYKDLELEPCYMLAGPCGQRLNIIKQLSAQISGSGADMSAGPSDIAILTDGKALPEQIYRSLVSQLEHGVDSKASLILIGDDIFNKWNDFYTNVSIDKSRISIIKFDNLELSLEYLKKVAPETAEIWVKSEFDSRLIKNCGVVYINGISSIGDYGAIGRGCADPTGSFSKSQSGLSPLTFMRYQAVVNINNIEKELFNSSVFLSGYEGLVSHKNAIEGLLKI